jgi:hypothetical protein
VSAPIRGQRERLELWLALAVTLAVAWSYLHDARRVEGRLTSRTPPGYYGLLTDALIAGRTNLDVGVDPLLLRLENPYAGPQGATRPHDMSFYRGKFYLYYGITPALILMVPWKVVTGTYIREITATALFCLGGFVLGEVWLVGLRRRLFPNVSPFWTVLALLVMGFGSPTFLLSNNSTFYAVPIAAAFFCLMAAVAMVDRAVRAPGSGMAVAWLAGASLAQGLAVGSRPNYVLGVALLLIPAAWLWWRLPEGERRRLPGAGIWAACILPAALVGAGLAVYNFRRFGSAADFGIQYTMSTIDQRGVRLMGPEALFRNLRLYLMHPASTLRYYPFFFSNGQPVGVVPRLTLVVAALVFPFTLRRRELAADPAWSVVGLFVFGAALVNLVVLCLALFPGVDRYSVDFAPPALLLSCAVLFAWVEGAAALRAPPRRFAKAAFCAVALWTVANGACFALATRVPTPFRARLEVVADRFVYAIEKSVGSTQGPLEMKVLFPRDAVGRREPIVTTGNMVGTGDIVYVLYPDEGHVQVGYFHMGAGGPLGEPMAVDLSVPHVLRVDLGSLYPPRRHPMFDAWSDAQVSVLRRRLEVTLDGKTALKASVDVYPSEPDGVRVGENPIASDVSAPRFTGKILEQRRLGLSHPASLAAYPGGPVLLKLRWSPILDANEPLVSTGRHGAGDLLNVQMLADGKVRFQHDSWDRPDVITEAISTDPAEEHAVEIEMGSLYPEGMAGVSDAQRRRLAIWVDGKSVVDMDRPFHPSTADEVEFGYNAVGGGSATSMFTGTLLGCSPVPARPFPSEPVAWGPVEMRASFRSDALGVNEPLLSTGLGDAATIVYVHYEDAGQVRFGYEAAGKGGETGPIVAIDFAADHRLEITEGALYPPDSNPEWASRGAASLRNLRDTVEVRLDGRVVLHAEHPLDASPQREVVVGRNDASAKNCLRVFGGQLGDVRRAAW